ncbi:uncharacterized protein [Procambarus clarkii]|uniref:uncharacterized protein isoform X2 n=1 Tax=Procambarus clarkii TaxID=6728 RepID=UPI003743F934
MASIPEREEVFVQDHDQVDLGWTYDKAQQKFLPCESTVDDFKICDPKFHFEILKKDSVNHLVEDSHVFSETAWAHDYKHMMKTGDVILLKGKKIIEKKSNNPVPHQDYIVSSVNFVYHVDMLIHSPYELGDNLLADLKKYLYSMVDDSTVSYIPNGLGMDHFNAVIYCPGNIRKCKSVKHALQEFCRLVKDSEASKHPFSSYLIKKPVLINSMSLSYASVLKDSKREAKEINLTSIPNTRQNLTGRNHPVEIKNRVIRSENVSKCEGNHVNGKKDSNMQENRNTWPGNESKGSYIKNAQTCNGSKNVSEKKKMSNGEPEEFSKEKKFKKDIQLTEVHVSRHANTLPKDNVSKSEIAVDNKKNTVTYTDSDKKGEKSSKGSTGFGYALRSKGAVPEAINTAQTQNKSSKNYAPSAYKVESTAVTTEGSRRHLLYNTEDKQHQAQFSNVADTLSSDSGKDLDDGIGINLDTIVATSDENKSDSFKLQQNGNGDEAGKSGDYPISHLSKPFQNLQSQGYCFSSSSTRKAHNSDPQIISRLSLNEMCNSENDNGKVNISVSSNTGISKDKFQEHFKHSDDENKEDFNLSFGYLKPEEEVFDECGMMRKYYGVRSEMKPKAIIILGASGSGKTTLVNFVANYYKGVRSADGELVHVVRNSNDVRSYTTSITAYTFCSGEHDTPITIIDTPGLNDSSGAEVRDHVQSLKTFLANAASQNYEIHAIGFVAQAHLVRLTSSERLVMDYVSTLFGQDIENHFFTFVTFADNQETPPVVEAMKNYGVKCNSFLKFNNSALSNNKTNEIDDLDRVYWRIGNKSWKKFMKSLDNLPALSVNTLKTLQNEVFTSTVVESAERELRTELKVFISYFKEGKYFIKETLQSCDKVWELASVVHHLRSNQMSNSMNVECILVKFAEEVCKENGISHINCIRLLSLAPSRQLLNAGIGVIQSIATLYEYAVNVIIKQRKTCSKIIPKFIYCHSCEKNHDLERVQPSSKMRIPILGSNAKVITYRCVKCECLGNVHGENPVDSSEGSPTRSLDLNKLLEHTRNCLADVIEKFSTPGYIINVDTYLKYINNVTNHEFNNFIRDLLQMTLK